ncbi:MAG: LptF/LptG family permease [Planctomycetota bacterium]|jgi:lipopolysaccharide export system permease protein
MLIIDRYLLRQFIKTFVICYLSLTGLYIVFDAFTHLDEFLNYSERGGLLSLMGSFYAYQSILFFELTGGLLTLVAAMFTLAWIQRHNELTALMSAGISRIRVVLPVICAAVVIALLGMANRELLIPRIRDELSRQPSDLMRDHGQPLQPRRDNQTNVLIRGKSVYGNRQRIEGPDFLLPKELGQYGDKLAAENAFYKAPEQNRPGGYLLVNVEQPKGLDSRPSLRLGSQRVLITPRDADWLEPGQCFLVSDVGFEQLTGSQAFRKFSSTPQLIAGLRNRSLGYGADVRVAIHSRMVQPFLDITLLFLGLPLVVSRESRNVFLAIGMCIGVVTVFLLVVIGFQYLGAVCLVDPALAAWAPLMLFVPPAVWLAESMWR